MKQYWDQPVKNIIRKNKETRKKFTTGLDIFDIMAEKVGFQEAERLVHLNYPITEKEVIADQLRVKNNTPVCWR
jgi:hypothetical protein